MPTRKVGSTAVSAIGLGAMPLSVEGRPDERQAIRTIHAALDAGATLIDTADAYCIGGLETGHNERLVAQSVRSWSGDRDSIVVATKGGHHRSRDGAWLVDGRPEHLRRACEASLAALGVDTITLYQHHRPDPTVAYEDSIGALRDLQDEGKVRFVGIGNASVAQIHQAMSIVEVASVQNEFSPAFRTSTPEIELCARHGIAFLAWGPLGGMGAAGALGHRHPAFEQVARSRGVTPQQVCLAWELARAPVVIPIPGSRRPETILDSLAAVELHLDEDELALLDADERPSSSPSPPDRAPRLAGPAGAHPSSSKKSKA
ncbi:MAG: aldo/keto reductase [Actinomycetota bacterium]|nr:aldo/keto reductase [Actinomycetota bacterium]